MKNMIVVCFESRDYENFCKNLRKTRKTSFRLACTETSSQFTVSVAFYKTNIVREIFVHISRY